MTGKHSGDGLVPFLLGPFTDNGPMTTDSGNRRGVERHREASWTIDEAALDRIEIGAGILGTGGGGNPYIGKLMARSLVRQGKTITVVPPESVPDDALVTSVGGMGSPTIGIERLVQGDEYLLALRTLEKRLGRTVTHVIPGEIGGSNSTRPLVVAAQTGLPVIDGDGMGRAFPELQMDTFSIYGPMPTPAAIADPYGQTALFEGISDPRTLERYARAVTIQMGGAAGYAFPPMSGADVKRTVVPHTMTLIHTIGDAVLRARAEHQDAIASLLRDYRRGAHLLGQDQRRFAAIAGWIRAWIGRHRRHGRPRRGNPADRLPERVPHRPDRLRPCPRGGARSDLHGRGRDRRPDHHRGAALRVTRRSPGDPGAGPAQDTGGAGGRRAGRVRIPGGGVRAASWHVRLRIQRGDRSGPVESVRPERPAMASMCKQKGESVRCA